MRRRAGLRAAPATESPRRAVRACCAAPLFSLFFLLLPRAVASEVPPAPASVEVRFDGRGAAASVEVGAPSGGAGPPLVKTLKRNAHVRSGAGSQDEELSLATHTCTHSHVMTRLTRGTHSRQSL